MPASRPHGLRTWIEIDQKAIAHNHRVFRSLIPKTTKLMGVVKSNAYGHYLVDFAKELEKLGADFLAVDSIVEALQLRKNGITCPILVLGHTLPEYFEEAAKQNISLAVSSVEQLRLFEKGKLKRHPKIHIKVDTGMHRQGFTESDMPEIAAFLKKNMETKRLIVEGVFTHFAGAKDRKHDYTKEQVRDFALWKKLFKQLGYAPLFHAAASGGTLLFPDAHEDMVRIGIGLYGIYPSDMIEKKVGKKIKLRPVLSWKTVIAEIKKLPKGSRIGYDGTEALKRASTVAVCPIGYWHGFPRALSSTGYVLVHGKRAKVLGRVSMDMISIDITGIKGVNIGDTVTIIGKDGNERLRAEDVARFMKGSSPYELVTRINTLIKRIFM